MKVVLITGATRNTGLAVAKRFAAEGYAVAITSRDGTSARETAEALEKEYAVPVRGYEMQLTDVRSIRQVFDRLQQDFGQLDVFVANSAHLGVGYSLLESTEEEFDAVADVNIKGTFFCCQCAARLMKETGGSIVTVGSVQGTGGLHGRAVYGMSKAALSVLVRYMAYELGQYHIRANNVVAGAVHSSRWDSLSSEELAARRSRYPAGRESTEEEIANAVWFLSSDQAASITGTDLTVDSGLTACLLPYTKKE
ncbi:MAG: SDR family oxidoreductase [Oscillospiraceae bacterium]|nr:SDR family oxidoreductase [Oscillospiraceae bacterium]